jgi:hypothetical protein
MTRPIRCGWCITGRHADCVVVVETGVPVRKVKHIIRVPKFWHCQCPEQGHPATRCVDCQRPGVDTYQYRCRDRKDCLEFRSSKEFKRASAPRILEESWYGNTEAG